MPIVPSMPASTIRLFSFAVHRLRLPFWLMVGPSQVPRYWTCERPSPNLRTVPFGVKHYNISFLRCVVVVVMELGDFLARAIFKTGLSAAFGQIVKLKQCEPVKT